MKGSAATHHLYHLAHLYGVQTSYYDIAHRRRRASVEALLTVLRALGAPVGDLPDIPGAIRQRRQALWQRPLEPVVVAWEGRAYSVPVRLPSAANGPLTGHLILESGQEQGWEWRGAELPVLAVAEVEGTQYVVKRLPVPGGLPWGYHRFTLELPGRTAEALIIAAPRRAYSPPEGPGGRGWGVFLPLYALPTQRSWGAGDLSDLEALMEWVAGMGGRAVATLPLLATFLDDPFEPSPYAPVSRLLWNEFYVDVTQAPELPLCPPAQALLGSTPFQEALDSLRRLPLVDYRRHMALKRRVLEELARCCFAGAAGLEGLQRFARAHPVVEDYARFRATVERRRAPWPAWPTPLRDGVLREGDYDEEARRYHLYVQRLAHQQLQALSRQAREKGLRLYFDLPLGSHPDGYDVWRERQAFVLGVSAGAPPDTFFVKGQDWGLPPLHPERLREQGYRYYIACLRHQLQNAGILRIDHVMGFHRLFWVPRGLAASQGVYVRYRAEEFYALLALESHRHQAIIVGEDLGTVPPPVRPAMARHGLLRSYVVQYSMAANPRQALAPVATNMVASLNTHDMPTFAAFWEGLDILEREDLGLVDEAASWEEFQGRQDLTEALLSFLRQGGWASGEAGADPQDVLQAILAFLGDSPARLVLVNLEDLWLEPRPHNVPGTRGERPNWRRRACYPLETFSRLPQVVEGLRLMARRSPGGAGGQ